MKPSNPLPNILQTALIGASLFGLPVQPGFAPFLEERFWPLCIAAWCVWGINLYNDRLHEREEGGK
jgi:hypothetical protein